MSNNVWLIGAGDFGLDIALTLIKNLPEGTLFKGFIDDRDDVISKTKKISSDMGFNFDFLKPNLFDFQDTKNKFIFGISDPKYKEFFCKKNSLNEKNFYKFIDSIKFSEHSTLGPSIYWNCNIASNVTIGYANFIDALTVVGHGVQIGNFCHIAVNVILGGNVVIDDCCYLHSGVIIGHNIRIGSGCIIGAGAVVLRDLPNDSVVVAPKSVKIGG